MEKGAETNYDISHHVNALVRSANDNPMQADDKSDETLQYDGYYAEAARRQGFYNEASEADTDDTQQRIEQQHADVADFRAQ